MLDVYFDCTVPAINEAGGEVIKFMGDAVLAFFHREYASGACAAGLQGALSALQRLQKLAISDAKLRAGIVLHHGEVSHGNYWRRPPARFDVDRSRRQLGEPIAGVCSITGQSVLMSEQFAELIDPALAIALGPYQLKGFTEPAELYTLTSLGAAEGGVAFVPGDRSP